MCVQKYMYFPTFLYIELHLYNSINFDEASYLTWCIGYSRYGQGVIVQ